MIKKEDKIKIYKRCFKYFMIASFITFLTLYLSQETGYYEYDMRRKTSFTKAQIEQFEKDVEAGKKVDIEDYLQQPDRNYGNKMSDLGYSISSKIGSGVKFGVDKLFGMLNKMVDE